MRNDWAIRFDVCERLARSSRAVAESVSVGVRDGVVRLSGRVSSRSEHDAAVQTALRVTGVRGIDDHIDIAPPPSEPSPARSS